MANGDNQADTYPHIRRLPPHGQSPSHSCPCIILQGNKWRIVIPETPITMQGTFTPKSTHQVGRTREPERPPTLVLESESFGRRRVSFVVRQRDRCRMFLRFVLYSRIAPMRNTTLLVLFVCPLVFVAWKNALTADPIADNQLVGTWKLVSVRNGGYPDLFNVGPRSKRETVMHITPTHLMTVTYAEENGTVLWCSGGAYTLKEGQYTLTIGHGIDPFDKPFKGKGHSRRFDLNIDGVSLRLTESIPDGGERDESWQRIK